MHFSGRPLLAASAAALFLLGARPRGAAPADVKAGVDRWMRGDYAGAIAAVAAARRRRQCRRPVQPRPGLQARPRRPGQCRRRRRAGTRRPPGRAMSRPRSMSACSCTITAAAQEALPWIRKAAELGDPRAQYILGTELFNGDLVAKDWPRAYALMLRAADGGVPPAADNLKAMERFIPRRPAPAGRRPRPAHGPPAGRRDDGQRLRFAPPVAAPTQPPGRRPRPAGPAPRRRRARLRPRRRAAAGGSSSAPSATPPTPSAPGRGSRARSAPSARFSPIMSRAGAVTRLQAGPLASRAAADRVCAAAKAAGAACFPVAP